MIDRYKGLTRDEVHERGKRLIDEKLTEEEIERRHGQMVAVDVLSGELGFGRTMLDAADDLRKRVTDPVTFIGRVGYPTASRIGFGGRKTCP